MSEEDEQIRKIDPAKWWVIALVISLSAGSLVYRLLLHQHLGQTAAMFLGIPAILAIILALAPKARTVTGGIFRGITLALLIIAPLLGEGYLCILLASPLFYLIGIVIGLAVDYLETKRTTTLSCVALILLPMCLEGVVPQLTWKRNQSVRVTKIVASSADDVAGTLTLSPRIQMKLPPYLRIGFPRPLEAHGEGLFVGATRTIHFSGAEGDPPGDLVMRVVESGSGHVRFATVSDESKLTQWLRWDNSEVEWKAIDGEHTQVTWTIHFDRQLDPAWYFVPWERAAVHEAAKYLIEANATPGGTAR